MGNNENDINPLLRYYIAKHCKRKSKNVMSNLYEILLNQKEKNNKCEDEMGRRVAHGGIWKRLGTDTVCIESHKTTDFLFWRGFAWKINMRYFLTPVIMDKYKRVNHFLYSIYKIIQPYWQEIIRILESI